MIAMEEKEETLTQESSLLAEMRNSRENANTAFITFCEIYRKFPNHAFCFFEGEDGKYYNQRIKSIVGNDIIPIKSGNKLNTLKAWRKIVKDRTYDSIIKMFFVDRDMDDLPDDKDGDLYVTPCYSIENLYVSRETFSNIIESEFSINKFESDYSKCLKVFENLYDQFCEEMVEFNALVLIRKIKQLGNGKVDLQGIKTNQLLNITLSNVSKSNKYILIINKLKEELQASEDELGRAINLLKSKGKYGDTFRGKNQLDFLVVLINLLKEAHRAGNFFDKRQSSVSVNITKNRLSELSQYAQTPDSLVKFLQTHKLQFNHPQ